MEKLTPLPEAIKADLQKINDNILYILHTIETDHPLGLDVTPLIKMYCIECLKLLPVNNNYNAYL